MQRGENRTIVSSFLWTQYWNVTDRQTDGLNPSGYYSAVHCGLAVKITEFYAELAHVRRINSCRYI